MLAGGPVEPEYGAEQPPATQDEQQGADQQEAFVERPRRPAQQQPGFLLLPFLRRQGTVSDGERTVPAMDDIF